MSASTIGAVSTGMGVAGTIGQTVGAYTKAKGDKSAYEYQSVVARNNAQLAEWQAHDAIERGVVTEQNQRLKTANLKGTQTASLAARNIDLSEGSAANILTDTELMGERDVATIRTNAAKEAWAHRVQAGNFTADARVLKARADSESPFMAAASTLLTSGGKVAQSWYSRKLAGVDYNMTGG